MSRKLPTFEAITVQLDPNLIKQQISNLILQYPELEEDEQLRADMIEGSTDAHDFLRRLERQRQDSCHLAGAIATNIAELSERQGRFERREQAMRGLMFKVLEAADLKKLELPEATISVAKGQQKLIGECDPAALPDSLCKIERKADRKAIKDSLKTGQTVPGYTLSNAEPHIMIRTK